MITVLHGDSRELLGQIPADSIDGCATDPPYALVSIGKRFGADGAAPAKPGKSGAYSRASAGFMGQRWDTGETAFDPAFWREVFRVLKPGAHLVAFGGTRTYHRLVCAIEDAGFEIRDQLAWLYGSGFPKSHNVAKGIQKRRVDGGEPTRRVCRFIRAAMDAAGIKSKDLTQHFGDCDPRLIDHWAARDTDSQPSLPTLEQYATLACVLGLGDAMDAEVRRLNDRKGEAGAAWSEAEVVGIHERDTPGLVGMRFADVDRSIRAPSAEAAAWEGWGTALKPALEPIVLARKPMIGSVAANVLEHGTGGLNVDACRIVADDKPAGEYTVRRRKPGAEMAKSGGEGYRAPDAEHFTGTMKAGRWPANVIHDGSGEVLEAFPADLKSGAGTAKRASAAGTQGNALGKESRPAGTPMISHDDSGSAARFFYSAKADAEDRLGSKHPTVKPVDLMAWLCRLVTPPGGTVLDPFAGTGTTGLAAMGEGFDCILIEREERFVADINRRLAWARGEGRTTALEMARLDCPKAAAKAVGADLPLFGGEAA